MPISEETKLICWVQKRGRERKEKKPRALLVGFHIGAASFSKAI